MFADFDGADKLLDFEDGLNRFDLRLVVAVHGFGDIDVIDNGSTVTVDYGTGQFLLANVGDPTFITSRDFLFDKSFGMHLPWAATNAGQRC